jgi:hypothetical protein
MTAPEQDMHFVMQQRAVCFHLSVVQVHDRNETSVKIFYCGLLFPLYTATIEAIIVKWLDKGTSSC